jgi:hypothetical protein
MGERDQIEQKRQILDHKPRDGLYTSYDHAAADNGIPRAGSVEKEARRQSTDKGQKAHIEITAVQSGDYDSRGNRDNERDYQVVKQKRDRHAHRGERREKKNRIPLLRR